MAVIESQMATASADFAANRAGHLALIEQLRDVEQRIRDASERARPRFRKRGQLTPRERLASLLDRGSPFVQLSTLCGFRMHDDDGEANVIGGGGITGIGFINGVRCLVNATDSGIRGGSATPMGVEKGLRAQEIALENRLPYVQLLESGGANLFRQADLFVKGGRAFANLARLSAAGIPVIAIVNGSSTAGGAYHAGLSDYVVLVRKRTRIFLAGPPLLKAATGEIANEEDLGGAEMHFHLTGTGEYLAEDDADGIRIGRGIVERLSEGLGVDRDAAAGAKAGNAPAPLYPAEDILGIVPPDYRTPYDVRELLARLVDGSDFAEFKSGYGQHTVTGNAEIGGHPVGIIGNNGPIDAQGAAKAAHFIQLCCQSGTPLIFLQNTTGFLVGREAEEAGIVKHGSKLIQAVSNATVPRITINIGASFGAGYYAMSGRGFSPRFEFGWPSYRISVMGGEQAAKTMAIVAEAAAAKRGAEPDTAAIAAASDKIVEAYDAQSSAFYATARLWDDGLIDPRDTRRTLIFCLETCRDAARRELRPSTFGVARF